MDVEEKKAARQLPALMEDAQKTCNQLYNYTVANFSVFSGSDDKKILEVIDNRRKIVETLIELEKEIDGFLPRKKDAVFAQEELPAGVEDFRRSARSVLDKVSNLDLKAMNLLSQKMQRYKDETLKLRNKKNISAYIRTSAMNCRGSRYDCKK